MLHGKQDSITITLTTEDAKDLLHDLETVTYVAGECALEDNNGVDEQEVVGRVNGFVYRLQEQLNGEEQAR